MSMKVMYNRLGEFMYERWKERHNLTTERYLDEFIEKDRIIERVEMNIKISALPEWTHRFLGVTSAGVPIWLRKKCQYRFMGKEVSFFVKPEYQSDIYLSDKLCKTEEVTSYVNWKKGNGKLAFIYLGVFWMLEEGETLNDAAKRFIFTHQEVKKLFRRRRKQGKHVGIDEGKLYIYELLRDGALIFKDEEAVLSTYHFYNELSGLWAIMAAEGFFSKEGVNKVVMVSETKDWN